MRLGSKPHYPEGITENSPAFQRRDMHDWAWSLEGTTEIGRLSRPFGTYPSRDSNSPLKRRAILSCPSGTEETQLAQNLVALEVVAQ